MRNNLKTYRLNKEKTIGEIAEYLHLDRDTYSKYEIDTDPIKVKTLIALCNYYEVTPNDLLGYSDTNIFTNEEKTYLIKAINILRSKL